MLIYADCGVVPVPTAPQLAPPAPTPPSPDAMQAAEAYRPPSSAASPRWRCFPSLPSAAPSIPRWKGVREAVAILRRRDAPFAFDGELQVDAALIPEIAARKAPGSPVAGQANVLVFPDLNSGNIAYKLSERLGPAPALSDPSCAGWSGRVHDLSRGCSKDDILDIMAITALDALRDDAAAED